MSERRKWKMEYYAEFAKRHTMRNAVAEGLKCLELVALGFNDDRVEICRHCDHLWTAHSPYCEVPKALQQMRDALAGQSTPEPASCTWTLDNDGEAWDTTCGHTFQVIDGGYPSDNEMRFCAHCGKTLIESRTSETPDKDAPTA